MQPEHRVHILTIAGTLVIMYFLATKVVPNAGWLDTWQGGVAAYVATFGAYKTLHWLLALAINNWRLLRRLFFRSYYVEGTWVGYYYGERGEVRYVVDVIEQRIGRPLHIEGHGYRQDGRVYAEWSSVTASVYAEGHQLIFVFDAHILSTGAKVDGITKFKLSRPKWFAPTWITGHATNTASGKRFELNEEKMSNGVVEPTEAYRKAREFHERTKAAIKS